MIVFGGYDDVQVFGDVSHFNATIISETRSPIQPCSVTNSGRQINGSDVNSVTTVCQPVDDLIYRDVF